MHVLQHLSVPLRGTLVGLLAALSWPGRGLEARQEDGRTVDFVRDVRPIFEASCFKCHGPEGKPKGQLRLDSRAPALRGGVSGAVFVPGKGRESRLYRLLVSEDEAERMPLKAPRLPRERIEVIRRWIDEGAPWPDAAAGEAKAETHWAYVNPVRPVPPRVGNAPWVRNPVDAFVAREHERRGLRPRPEAPRAVLLRRVTLDLVGLPPTREELSAFLADPAPDAYEKAVDRLLADPRHGERWGRHWMDVWRYSDMTEFEQNQILSSQRHVWRWRDWIVESLNADKGYDRMVLEMLAGDEIAPEDRDALRATGFLARNYYKLNRNVWLEGVVEHTAKAFLATTVNCARCHNHFFDPVSQQEYYQFRAFFEPHQVRTDPVPGESDFVKDGLARVYDAELEPSTYLLVRGEEKSPDKTRPIVPGVPVALGGRALAIRPVTLPASVLSPERQEFVRRDLVASAANDLAHARQKVETTLREIARLEQAVVADGAAPAEIEKSRTDLQAALEELPAAVLGVPLAEARQAALEALFRVERIEEAKGQASDAWKEAARETSAAQRTHALLAARRGRFLAQREAMRSRARVEKSPKGDKKAADALAAARKKLEEAEKALAQAERAAGAPPTPQYTARKIAVYPASSTGRRLALARWIADPENPLTARVAINHLWMRHFGKGLVGSAFDFGTQGKAPSHPALLDWLATELIRGEWRMKELHRLLVTSSAYRMDSLADAKNLEADPENRYLWRMNARRMEAEAVRDGVLYVAGQLDPSVGGPELDPALGLTSGRRSLYFRNTPEKRMEFVAIFDGASASECYERTHTIVPQQALALLNSSLALDAASLLARRLLEGLGPSADAGAFVAAAFEAVLARAPTVLERKECEQFLEGQEAASRARENLVHVLFNHHDFVTVR